MVSNILGRLPPCSLAASRCVRKNWCAIIDSRHLLRADLLPLRLDGFFFLGEELGLECCQTYFFSRPSTGRRISGNLSGYDDDGWILDHCNGVLLLWELLVNPATRQSVRLPPFPELSSSYHESYFLAYDPMASSSPQHYEVLVFPTLLLAANNESSHCSSWPPSPFAMHVFSSRKWRWEERSFLREGNDDTVAHRDMLPSASYYNYSEEARHAVYLRRALYVHCQNDSVMRITLWNDKYQMIESPAENQVGVAYYIGKSQQGVYYASLSEDNRCPRFRVWLLNESSCSKMEWSLKNDISLKAMLQNFPSDYTRRYNTPWILNYQKDVGNGAWIEDDPDWDFESGIVLDETKDETITTCYKGTFFLGFHPHKEIAFFFIPFSRVVSHHLNSSTFQELGLLNKPIMKSFPYTPCWMGELFENN
ncbi:hypothetical protein PR202_gb00781 [Eleusine coracana subsp. coracana]|uniref:F-box domain-containing protein n=1 Tax=Eleusine coracana subsp. coracana TaxID=191504 RepID=A0AAV5DUW7_ELECO|nr:hypothetical protein PR202_gb00781 [Eleusine coracana subsp. coracana]